MCCGELFRSGTQLGQNIHSLWLPKTRNLNFRGAPDYHSVLNIGSALLEHSSDNSEATILKRSSGRKTGSQSSAAQPPQMLQKVGSRENTATLRIRIDNRDRQPPAHFTRKFWHSSWRLQEGFRFQAPRQRWLTRWLHLVLEVGRRGKRNSSHVNHVLIATFRAHRAPDAITELVFACERHEPPSRYAVEAHYHLLAVWLWAGILDNVHALEMHLFTLRDQSDDGSESRNQLSTPIRGRYYKW